MNDRPAFWFIYLLTYLNSERAMPGSRRVTTAWCQWFRVTWVSATKIKF